MTTFDPRETDDGIGSFGSSGVEISCSSETLAVALALACAKRI